VVRVVDLRQLFGIHLAPQVAEIGDGIEAARPFHPVDQRSQNWTPIVIKFAPELTPDWAYPQRNTLKKSLVKPKY